MTNTIIKQPVITEKSLLNAKNGWFTFLVSRMSTKNQIRSAIHNQFGVDVTDVRTVVMKGKSQRVGKQRREIALSPVKKAMVRLGKEQKIDLFDVGK